MTLTPWGKAIRVLRIELDIKPKDLASKLGISLSYLGLVELGRKRLTEEHLNNTIEFLSTRASEDQLNQLKIAAEQSNLKINISALSEGQKGLIRSFTRRIKEGKKPNHEILKWLSDPAQIIITRKMQSRANKELIGD